MKYFLISAIALIVIVALVVLLVYFPRFNKEKYSEIRQINGQDYRMTFYDDFDTFDKTKWVCCPEWERGDLGGHWRDSRVRTENGCLILTTGVDASGKPETGAVHSKGRFKQAGGYFECRCRVQKQEGIWTAFWLMCPEEAKVGNGAADGAEIDIMESYDVKNEMINHALHWDGYKADHRQVSKGVHCAGAYEGFHTYALLWTDTAYIFYIDGEESYRIEEGDENYPGCCQAKTYLVLSVEAGKWGGNFYLGHYPEESMVVDYVKVYQKV